MERKIIAAWIVGWLVYMAAMAVTVYDGLLSLICQPFVGVLFATIAVLVSGVASLVFLIPRIWDGWCQAWFLAPGLIVASILLFCFGPQWGLGQEFPHPETGDPVIVLNPDVAIGGYLAIVFAVLNWPETKSLRRG